MFDDIIDNQINNFSYLSNEIKSNELIKNQIYNLVELLVKYNNNTIYFLGVGKSGNLANHLSDILKSISFKTNSLNVTNLTHGDIGCVSSNDLVIFISKSGNTKEILDVIDNFNCHKVLICNSSDSKISKLVSSTYLVPLQMECDLNFNLIPSNSIVNTLIYFNFVFNLVSKKKNLLISDYKQNHPSGDIGLKTKKVEEFISNDILVVDDINLTLEEVAKLMNSTKMGLIFTDKDIFYGILTTKDLLKTYIEISNDYQKLTRPIRDYINKSPTIIEGSKSLISKNIDLIRKYKYFKFIPVIEDGKYIGIIDNSKILKYI
jgi:arabinose-5-phosphate isomerase